MQRFQWSEVAVIELARGCSEWAGQIMKYVGWLEAEKLCVTRSCREWAGQKLQYVGWPEVAASGLEPNLVHPPSSSGPSGSIPPREGGRINKHWPRAELFVLLDLSVLLT